MTIAAIIFILAGLFFFFVGVVGILRFPDFYSRLHAAGKADSLAAVLVIIGVALYNLQEITGKADNPNKYRKRKVRKPVG